MADTHRIRFEPVDIEMDVTEDDKILDAAFRQGIHLMHGCKEGQCSACKSYVLEGDLQMERYSTFACNDAEVAEGYVLLCRAHAFSDCTIELLNFDEDELLGGIPIQTVPPRVAGDRTGHPGHRLAPAEADRAAFEFRPGQYVDITIPGTDDHRSFSMATTQSTPDELEFLIKKYPGGRFSALLDGELAVGDELSLTGPYGSSTLKDGQCCRSSASPAGPGWRPSCPSCGTCGRPAAPGRSGSTTAPVRRPTCSTSTRSGARCGADRLRVRRLPVRVGSGRGRARGRGGNVTDIVERREAELHGSEVYLCGPPPMVDAALALLEASNVPKDQVFYDKFTSPERLTDGTAQ